MRLLLFFVCLVPPAAWAHNCVPGATLAPAASIKGTLNEANCRLPGGLFLAEHPLTLPTHGRLELTAASSDFPVRMILRDAAGGKLSEGASILRSVERGDYTVIVTSAENGQSGAYSLDSRFLPEPNTLCRLPQTAGPWQTLAGSLTANSCRLPDGSAYDAYLVNIFGSGTLEIAMEADGFEASVILRDSDGRALGTDPKKLPVPWTAMRFTRWSPRPGRPAKPEPIGSASTLSPTKAKPARSPTPWISRAASAEPSATAVAR